MLEPSFSIGFKVIKVDSVDGGIETEVDPIDLYDRIGAYCLRKVYPTPLPEPGLKKMSIGVFAYASIMN